MNDYYVYVLKYRNKTLYVGYGKGDRIDHVLSGTSHNKALNTFVAFGFNDKDTDLNKIICGLTEKQARNIEAALIDNLKPLFNIKGGNSSALKVAEYLFVHCHVQAHNNWNTSLDDVLNSHSYVEY